MSDRGKVGCSFFKENVLFITIISMLLSCEIFKSMKNKEYIPSFSGDIMCCSSNNSNWICKEYAQWEPDKDFVKIKGF